MLYVRMAEMELERLRAENETLQSQNEALNALLAKLLRRCGYASDESE